MKDVISCTHVHKVNVYMVPLLNTKTKHKDGETVCECKHSALLHSSLLQWFKGNILTSAGWQLGNTV